MGQWNLAETTWGLAAEQYAVAVLPVGATEAHGPHLPYATDTLQCEALARRACQLADSRGARVLCLPALPYSVCENGLGFRWTMSLRPSTLFRVVTDLVASCEAHGIPKLLLLNGHGGNEFQPHLRELCRQTSVQLMLVNWWQVDREAHARLFVAPGEHADEMETSLMLALHPDLVHLDRAGDGATRAPRFTAMQEGWAWVARPWERLTIDGTVGDPTHATAAKGAAFLEALTEKLANLLVELANSPVDDWYPYQGR